MTEETGENSPKDEDDTTNMDTSKCAKLFIYRYLIKQTKKPKRNLLAKTNIDTIAYDISVCPFVQRNIIMAQRYVFYFGKSNIPTEFYF